VAAEIRLGELDRARRFLRELASLEGDNLNVLLAQFDLALAAGDHDEAFSQVDAIRAIEGEDGTTWLFAQAALLIDKIRRGAPENLEEARRLAAKISEQRPQWASGVALNGEIAELSASTDQAISHYLRAVELGNVQPSLVRRLVGLLNAENRFDDIDHVAQVLRDQGAALDEITMVKAFDAIRKQDFEGALRLARQVFSAASTNAADHLTLGRFYMAARRTGEAGREFRRAVELGPGVPESWITYVRYLVEIKQIDQARAAVGAARNALSVERATTTLAHCWMLLGDLKEAELLVSKAINDEGQSADPSALKLAATCALKQNRLAQVDEYLNKLGALAGLATSDRAWANRVRIALLVNKGRASDQDQALALVEQNLRIDPNSAADQQLKVSILALRPTRRGEAIAILERQRAANALDPAAQFLLAQLHLGQGSEEKYQKEMLKLLGLKSKNPQQLAHFVNYWIGHGRLGEADRWLAELKQAEPKGATCLEQEARLLDLRKRRPELAALLAARRQQVPDQIGLVADLYDRYGFAKEGEEAYRAFVARDPKQPERVLALAIFLTRHDRVAEAIELLRTAWSTCAPAQVAGAALAVYDAPSAGETHRRQVEAWLAEARRHRPGDGLLATRLGVIWIRQGRFDEADDLFRRLLAGDPENVDALNNLAWLISLRGSGKANEAVELVDRAIAIEGEAPFLADTRAIAKIQSGQVEAALSELRAIRRQAPENPSYAWHLAWAYHALGQNASARLELQAAEKLGLKPAALDPLELAVFQRLRKELSPG
jgi:predicted Zn-dependent protease